MPANKAAKAKASLLLSHGTAEAARAKLPVCVLCVGSFVGGNVEWWCLAVACSLGGVEIFLGHDTGVQCGHGHGVCLYARNAWSGSAMWSGVWDAHARTPHASMDRQDFAI